MKVTIGIPAFNEANNISNLLNNINSQVNIDIVEVIIVNDGSTDNTLEEITKAGFDFVRVVNHEVREGKISGINKIFNESQTDILILMDADVQLPSNSTIVLSCDEFLKSGADLSALRVEPIKDSGVINNIVSFGQYLKNLYYKLSPSKDNIHTCVGRTLILDKKFYKTINIPYEIVEDDAYLYLTCKKDGHKYKYIESQFVEYKSPRTISDFIKQNRRYEASKQQLIDYFEANFLNKEYSISFRDKFKVSLIGLYENTFMYLFYAGFYFGVKLLNLISSEKVTNKWSQARSTK